jgi:hypothetical protein
VEGIVNSILHKRKLRFRKVKQLAKTPMVKREELHLN